uniref:PHD-type domain-containing protein n=1 Tax=Photinus pyralis TaxID=7054 RepID=A0A1Y1MM79_PHOPY
MASASCPICYRKITLRQSKIICEVCNGVFHEKCTELNRSHVTKENENWICQPCTEKRTIRISAESKEQLSISGIISIINEMRNEQMQVQRRTNESLRHVSRQVDDLKSVMMGQTESMRQMIGKIASHPAEGVPVEAERSYKTAPRLVSGERSENRSEVASSSNLAIKKDDIDVNPRLMKNTSA